MKQRAAEQLAEQPAAHDGRREYPQPEQPQPQPQPQPQHEAMLGGYERDGGGNAPPVVVRTLTLLGRGAAPGMRVSDLVAGRIELLHRGIRVPNLVRVTSAKTGLNMPGAAHTMKGGTAYEPGSYEEGHDAAPPHAWAHRMAPKMRPSPASAPENRRTQPPPTPPAALHGSLSAEPLLHAADGVVSPRQPQTPSVASWVEGHTSLAETRAAANGAPHPPVAGARRPGVNASRSAPVLVQTVVQRFPLRRAAMHAATTSQSQAKPLALR